MAEESTQRDASVSQVVGRLAAEWDGSWGEPQLDRQARAAVDAAVERLLGQQADDGYWCGELEGDSILESEYLLLKWILGQEDDVRLPKIANYLRAQQRRDDGAWIQYPGAKADLSATVKAYFALKLMGDDPDAPHMARARRLIHQLGGADRSNTYTRFYLAALGQLDYRNVPTVPPEVILLPRWFYFHISKISAWSRTMLMPLTIVSSYRPRRELPEEKGIRELYLNQDYIDRPVVAVERPLLSWKNFFFSIDIALKLLEATRFTPLRRIALARVERWLLQHTEQSDGLGAIFPPMVYILIALRCRGYGDDRPEVRNAQHELDRLMIEEGETIRIQPCFSPVWDTGIAAYALAEAGSRPDHEALQRAARWLVSKECRFYGDWRANVPEPVEPSGWFFEFNNAFYPDVDDTAMVAMALHRIDGREAMDASRRGADWILAMQNKDGGWAAFDRTEDRPLLEHIPFADHNAIQDPSCPDITGRCLECLAHHGFRPDDRPVAAAVDFLRRTQEPEGCWFGRWGVNYLYGTWQVLSGLRRVGVDMSEPWVRKAADWLRSVQKEDGSFGESADSYEDPTAKGRGPSTPSQTAWGVMAQIAADGRDAPGVREGIRWLVDSQDETGQWEEHWFTGTGFPRVFYLRYHLYRLYFPVMCLGRWLRAGKDGGGSTF